MDLERNGKYERVASEELPDIHAHGYLLRHKKSGARVMLLVNDDENKVFNIAFRTPPADSTGVAHILEHSVLCGSRQFPLKDPFVELVKGSLNTFLNAMTYPDKTMYPVASCNDQDFRNLMHVYMDAVFYPAIYSKEEIFRQEGWHYQLESAEDPLIYNGVVYNEMKGVFSSADEIIEREILNTLFPDTAYGVESGGDPKHIPDLSYEDFLAFHARYYHPSNSYIYLYGNMDMEERLDWMDREYLGHFDRITVESGIGRQEPFARPARRRVEYPVAENGSERETTYLVYSAVVGDSLDVELCTAFEVLDYVLLSAPGAPLKQALLDAGIGRDIEGGYNDGLYQPYFTVMARQAEAEDADRFLSLVRGTLERIAREGIDRKAVLAGINYLEFRFREADFGQFPRGLMYGIDVFDSWLYDEGKPFDQLKRLDAFATLKKKADGGFFEGLIRQYLLDNPHRMLLTGVPKKGLAAREEEETARQLEEYKNSLSGQEIETLVKKTEALRAFQEAEDDEEAKKMLPMLSRGDIRRTAGVLYNKEERVGDTLILRHDIAANDITYMTLLFDTERVPDELIEPMAFLKAVLGYVDTEHYTYGELFHEINASSGGVSTGLQVFNRPEPDSCARMFGVRAKFLAGQTDFVFRIIREILCSSRLDDDKRLHEILNQQKARMESALAQSGHSTAVMRAASYHSPVSQFQDRIAGISYFRYLEDLAENFETKSEKLKEDLKALLPMIFRKENLMVSVTADDAGVSLVKERIAALADALYTQPAATGRIRYEFVNKREGFTTAGQVQYVAVSGNFAKAGYAYTGALRILKVILNYDYLWINLRVTGGAYGCMSGFRRNGDSYLVSYRDPHLTRTWDVFAGTPEYIRQFAAGERDMTKYIIGTISELDTPLNPAAKGAVSLNAWFAGITQEDLQRERDEILDAQPEDIRALAGLVEAVLKPEQICVVGSETAIAKRADFLCRTEPLAR